MSNLPFQSAVNRNDDNDEQTNCTANKLASLNSRITSPLIIKRQQNTETEIANNQAYDEIHDLQPKHSLSKRIDNDNTCIRNFNRQNQSNPISSRDLMQGNYYDQARFNTDYNSSSNHQPEPILIDINVEDYKKTFAPVSTSKNSNNKNRTRSPPFGDTSESIQHGIAQSAGFLLEINKKNDQQQHKSTIKTSTKSHEQAVIDYFPNDTEFNNQNINNTQRSLSPSSTDDSSSDTSSNKSHEDISKTNIPYEKLLNNDDNEDEQVNQQTSMSFTESSNLLNKNQPQTYGTQSITNVPYERSKYLPNNGYNSHGSSVTTKSSSDNSGSVRTNSGTDNDEESDEEHYNNSTLSNNSFPISLSRTKDSSIKSSNKTSDMQNSHLNDPNHRCQLNRINMNRINNNDETLLQVPRMKQLQTDDLNGNVNKLNATTDHNVTTFSYKTASQTSSNIPMNTSSSSHQNRNSTERNEQHSNFSRNNTCSQQSRGKKKRKLQQQDIIRTELIPGHRGDLDVDELVMFIHGDSVQQQNSTPLRPTDTNKPRLSVKNNSINDSNSNKTSSRKKTRKTMNNSRESITSKTINDENTTSNNLTTVEQMVESTKCINEENKIKIYSTNNTTNQSSQDKQISINNNDESHLNTNNTNTIKIINNNQSNILNASEQMHKTSLKTDEIDPYSSSFMATNILNSEIISEPFVTVKNRRRTVKERRQDNNVSIQSAHVFPLTIPSSKTNDKRRIPSNTKNEFTRPIIRNNLPNNKLRITPVVKDEPKNSISIEPVRSAPPPPSEEPPSLSPMVNPTNEQPIEKSQISPRLSSHSSSSSLSFSLKRQSKPPPVIFLNKAIDIELNDVSFGFEVDSNTSDRSSDDDTTTTATVINNNSNINKNDNQETTTKHDIDTTNTITFSSNQPTSSNDNLNDSMTQKSHRRFPLRNNRSPQFYSGSDIRLLQQRPYPTQPMPPSSYLDPLLFYQYNQRFQNYSQNIAYTNLLRTHYLPHQSPYVLLPTTYATTTSGTTTIPTTATTTTATTTTNETESDEPTHQTSSDPVQESLLVYATPSGQFYYHPSTIKKSPLDSEQQSNVMSPVYTTTTMQPSLYPSPYFYPAAHASHLIPSNAAYFQPIPTPASSSLLVDTKPELNNMETDDNNYKSSGISYPQTRQQSSSDIMSNALQLVYSHQRRNAQTDRFNLDDLTAYLAMKWTDTVDHYEQGDNRVLLVYNQEQ